MSGYFRGSAAGDTLTVDKHSSGFFSNCSVLLHNIISYFNQNKKLPQHIICPQLYNRYKYDDGIMDMHGQFFASIGSEVKYDHNIRFSHKDQYMSIDDLQMDDIGPFIKKYFTPHNRIKKIESRIMSRYNVLNKTAQFQNACAIVHRGTDKSKETTIPELDSIITQADILSKSVPDIIFILQSDCAEFMNVMTNRYKGKCISFDEFIRVVGEGHRAHHWRSADLQPVDTANYKSREHENFTFIQNYIAITNILSKCKYLICETGNCGLWLLLYRGHKNNVIQFQGRGKSKGTWYNTINK